MSCLEWSGKAPFRSPAGQEGHVDLVKHRAGKGDRMSKFGVLVVEWLETPSHGTWG